MEINLGIHSLGVARKTRSEIGEGKPTGSTWLRVLKEEAGGMFERF